MVSTRKTNYEGRQFMISRAARAFTRISKSERKRLSKPFPFFSLPTEVRLLVYEHMFPSPQRIFLDPMNFYHPLPYKLESFGETMNVLLVNKKIHTEAIQFIFKNKMVNIIRPLQSPGFLKNLGNVTCQFITTLEIHVEENLTELTEVWKPIGNCPRLENIRLVFYHIFGWQNAAARITNYVTLRDPALLVDLELYTSVWAPRSVPLFHVNGANFNVTMQHAAGQKTDPLKLPKNVRHITATASVSAGAAQELVAWEGLPGIPWSFKLVKDVKGPPQMRVVRWTKRTDA